jgi:hypothetical protein
VIEHLREAFPMNPSVLIMFLVAGFFLVAGVSAETSTECSCSYDSANITYENHTIYFQNNCSQSVWIAANMGPNGPPFVLNNVSQGRGCTGCSCAGPASAGWENGGCCCPSISCTQQSCPNSSCSQGVHLPNGGGFEVPPGLPVNYTVQADPDYGGNAALFPRYGCTLSPDGVYLDCDTGTCYVQGTAGTSPEGLLKCGGVPPNGPPDGSSQLPTTKMEIFFAPTGWVQSDSDFYDVSLADGFNIPVQIEPVPGTYWTGGSANNWCIRAGGTVDLLEKIQEPQYQSLAAKMLVLKNNRPVAIWSSCSYETQVNKTGPGQENATTTPGQGEQIWNLSCCKGNCGTEATCPIGNLPTDHQTSQFFSTFYDHTYTYQYGDDEANIPCKGEKSSGQLTSYLITFCGGRILATATTHIIDVTNGNPVAVSDPASGVNLTLTTSSTRQNQRVGVFSFEPDHPPQNFSSPITPVGGYFEVSSSIPTLEIAGVTITARYHAADIPAGMDESNLRLFVYAENGTWVLLTPGGVDTVNTTVWGETDHFSVFAVSEYNPPLIGNLSAEVVDPADPLTVRFMADVESGSPLIYSWDVETDGIEDYTGVQPSHSYDTPGAYRVTLTVTDESGLSAQAEETFVISDYRIPILPGWNFISVPLRLDPGHDHASTLFAPVDSAIRVVLTYDATTGQWGIMGPDTPVVPLQGFWLRSDANASLPLLFDQDPAQLPPTLHLYPGWNAIGLGDTEPLAARLALQAVQENWSVLIPFNATEQRYETSIINGGSGSHSDDRGMEPGQGYWVFMTGEGELPATGA